MILAAFRPARRGACAWAAACALLATAPVQAQRDLTKNPDPDPEIERRSFQLAEGFEVNLFAADPLLAKPIQMNFDSLGRLWVACSEVYPQIKPGQKANDKIVVLEDREGKGRADKSKVFADGLLIPTAVEPGDGGVYVADSTDLVHLTDARGTGRADRRRVVLSGFGTEDTHHILHTLRWGPDGMLYFNQSIYIHSHVETPYGVRRLGGGGLWQFRPETMRLEVFARGFCNPWGHHFDRWGQSFVTDGAYFEGINYLIPGASYATAPGAARVLPGLNPGTPKFCGLEILSGRHLPPEWRGTLLTNDFRGHRVCRFAVSEDGAGYVSRENAELIKTNHPAFRPVDIKTGPDGAIYIADWYNPIIQHGEVDFRDPRRDHTHGRIWRVTVKGQPALPRPRLVGVPTADLLEALKAPEDWTRHHAKRMLKERGRQVLGELKSWVAGLPASDPELEHYRLEALWAYQALDVVEPELLSTLLNARDHRARAAAVRVAAAWHERLPQALNLLAERVADPHPKVRLEAVRALAQIPGTQSMEAALAALDQPVDRFLDYALWLTARDLAPAWMPALQKGELEFRGNTRHLLFALQAVGSPNAVRPLVDLFRAGKVASERRENVLALIAELGGPAELGLLFDALTDKNATDAGQQAMLLAALEQAARQRGVRPAGDPSRLARLLGDGDDAVRASALRTAGLWKLEALWPQLDECARAADTPEPVRRAALEGLAALGGLAARKTLEDLAREGQPLAVRTPAVIGMASVDVPAAALRAAELMAANPSEAHAAELFSAFLERKNGPDRLAEALKGRHIPADVAKIGIRTVRASGRDAPRLAAVLGEASGVTPGPRKLTPEQMRRLVEEVAERGDPARGEAVFRRKDQGCLRCHALAGAGGQVGPDLAGIGASAPVDYLVEAILEPNKAIKEGYHALAVATKEGRLFTGIKVRETATELVLRDAEDREVAIPVNSIEEKTLGGSLMPEGLADPLTHAELVDLVRFLSDLGKIGPYTVSKAPLVRRWQVLEDTPAARACLAQAPAACPSGSAITWAPAYGRVSGDLPLDAMPAIELKKTPGPQAARLGFVRCQVETSAAGKVKVRLNATAGLTLWVDGVPAQLTEETVLHLKAGLHTFTFGFDPGRRRGGLRCQVEDAAGSTPHARILGGK